MATPEEGGHGSGADEGRVIEVPDHPRGQADTPGAQDDPDDAPDTDGQGGGPYRNLLVPLIVVPALIVMVFVLVWTFFGTITGRESSPEENVERLLHGGANERTQAAFNLVRQALEDWEAGTARGEGAWHLDETLLPKLRRAWEDTSDVQAPGDVPIPLALGILLAQLGDPDGVARLAAMTRLSPEVDPAGEYRAYAGFALGSLGKGLAGRDLDVAREALVALLGEEDQGLRLVAAIALQAVPGPETVAVLRGLLRERSLEMRGNAALSLARLGDGSGAAVLREMLSPEAYRAEHEEEARKWAKARLVSESRCKALAALDSIDALPPADELARLAQDDPDPEVRQLARRILDTGHALTSEPAASEG